MKKLFVSILALAAFAACQSDFNNDVNLGAPQGGSVVSQGEHTIYAEVGVGEEGTKATYGDDLKALWEENDQIALLQEHADYGKTFAGINKLNIKEGWGTSLAKFNGDITVDATDPRVYHIAYPASAVEFSTSSSMSVEGVSYQHVEIAWDDFAYARERATGYGKYTYNSTLNITVPAAQSGKWEPYMYASTSEAVSSNGIGAKTLTTLTGAIAIRAFEADGKTTKQLKQITITSSDAAIAGTFSGTATSVGNTTTIHADSDRRALGQEGKCREEALARLTTALQSYEPTSTTVTKAMSSLTFNGTGKSITLSNLENIPMDSDDCYTYYINVAPTTIPTGTLTIEVIDTDGAILKRTVNKEVAIAASHRAGFNFIWEPALIPGTIETWYDNWNTSSFELAGKTIYARNIGVQGVAANQVLALGVEIDGQLHASSAQSGVLSQKELKIEGVSNGTYSICTYAKIMLNGKETVLKGDVKTITVTPIPTATYSVYTSYSNNGGKALRNDVYGNEYRARVDISDAYIQTNFVKSTTLTYGGSSVALTLGQEWKTTLGYGSYSSTIKVELKNGYTLTSPTYATYVTGIPYTLNTSSNDDWSTSGSVSWGSYVKLSNAGGAASMTKSFKMPADTSVKVVCNATAGFGTINTNFSVEVSGSKIFDEKGKAGAFNSSGKDLTCDKTTTMTTNSSVKLANSYGLGNTHSRVHSLNITYNL